MVYTDLTQLLQQLGMPLLSDQEAQEVLHQDQLVQQVLQHKIIDTAMNRVVNAKIIKMKLQILVLLLLCCKLTFAQEAVKVENGTSVIMNGNAAIVVEKMNLVNNGNVSAFDQSTLGFTGNTNNEILGVGSYALQNLLLNKSNANGLRLKQHITVSGTLQFQSGLLDLDNYSVDLGSLGSLTGESELSRAYTMGTGYLRSVVDMNKAGTANPGNLGAAITSATAMGITEIKRGHSISSIGLQQSIKRYYDIIPQINTALNASLNARYFDAELNSLDEQQLSFWKSSDLANWDHAGYSTRDGNLNYVELQGIASFSRWTLSEEPGVTCNLAATIPDAYAMDQGVPVNTVYLGYQAASSITLVSSVTGGTLPYQYQWRSGSPTGTIISTNASVTVQPVVNTTYYLLVTDANGCVSDVVSKLITVIDVRCGNKLDKVPVCIYTGSKPKTICVSPEAVDALLQSGATLGPCGSNTITKSIPAAAEKDSKPLAYLSARVLPNPAADYFNIIITGINSEPVSLRIMDNAGRVIEIKNNLPANGMVQVGGHYRPGVYYAEIIQGKEKVVLKLVKGIKSF